MKLAQTFHCKDIDLKSTEDQPKLVDGVLHMGKNRERNLIAAPLSAHASPTASEYAELRAGVRQELKYTLDKVTVEIRLATDPISAANRGLIVRVTVEEVSFTPFRRATTPVTNTTSLRFNPHSKRV